MGVRPPADSVGSPDVRGRRTGRFGERRGAALLHLLVSKRTRRPDADGTPGSFPQRSTTRRARSSAGTTQYRWFTDRAGSLAGFWRFDYRRRAPALGRAAGVGRTRRGRPRPRRPSSAPDVRRHASLLGRHLRGRAHTSYRRSRARGPCGVVPRVQPGTG